MDRVLAAYQVEELIGRGGMGEVYLAHDPRLGRPVALKVLGADIAGDQRFRERLLRESRLAAALDHPNVVPIYEAGEPFPSPQDSAPADAPTVQSTDPGFDWCSAGRGAAGAGLIALGTLGAVATGGRGPCASRAIRTPPDVQGAARGSPLSARRRARCRRACRARRRSTSPPYDSPRRPRAA